MKINSGGLCSLSSSQPAMTRPPCIAQARSAPDWTTQGFDAQRTSWMRVDPYISLDNLSKFQFLWKLKVDNESRHGNALTAPWRSAT